MGGGASVSNTEVMISTAAVTSSPICPLALCHREMQPETSRDNAEYDSTTGLRCFRCPTCGHIGGVAAGGLQLVFRLAHQYVLTHDLYRSTITVLLPARSIAMCQGYGLGAEGLAKHAAEWALLSGNRSDTVSVVPERQDIFRLYLLPQFARVANSLEPAFDVLRECSPNET